MMKDSTFADKFTVLSPWMSRLTTSIKGDLKREHLKREPAFVKAHFSTKDVNRIGADELTVVYTKVLSSADAEATGELVTNIWLLKHGEIYRYFETELSKLASDFTTLESISDDKGQPIIDGGVREFGAIDTYLFAVLNSVVFTNAIYEKLRKLAEEESAQTTKEPSKSTTSDEASTKNHEREIARLHEKYEKKLAGLQQKYLHDIDIFKKEVARLRQKLAEVSVERR